MSPQPTCQSIDGDSLLIGLSGLPPEAPGKTLQKQQDPDFDLDLLPRYAKTDDIEMGLLGRTSFSSGDGPCVSSSAADDPRLRYQNNDGIAWRYVCPMVATFFLLFGALVVVPISEIVKRY
ncbi:hypothetical protein BDW68DRAFT_183527 [Aspergillus falconensis]